MKSCRTCGYSDKIDNEIDLHTCSKDGETVSGNNCCNEWVTGEIDVQSNMVCAVLENKISGGL